MDRKGDPNVYDQEGDMEIEKIDNIVQNCEGDCMATDEVMREEISLLENYIDDSVRELNVSNNRNEINKRKVGPEIIGNLQYKM